MNIIFAFRFRYRRDHLSNLLKLNKIKNFRIYNFSGPVLYLFGILLSFLRFGKTISCDGNPLIKTNGINLWMGGTNFKIPTIYNNLNNNYVNMKSIFLKNEKLFQIYPLNIIKNNSESLKKIIYISSVNISQDKNFLNFWKKNKGKILEDFTLIDNLYFWKKFDFYKNKNQCFYYYRNAKRILRFQIVKDLKKKYKENFILKGSDWSKYGIDSLNDNYSFSKNLNLYNGNICLDFGSISGSLTLYPRSIGIIESGGLLIQQKQNDFNLIWKKKIFKNINSFKNYESLFFSIDFFLKNSHLYNNFIDIQNKNFDNAENLLNKQFKKIFMIR